MTNAVPDPPDPRDSVFAVEGMTEQLSAKTGRSAITILLFSAAKIFVALGAVAILARLVPPVEYGVVAMAMPIAMIAAGLSEFGLAQAIVQRPHVTHRMASALLWIGFGIGLFLTLLMAGSGPQMARFYDTPAVALLMVAMSPYVLFSALSSQYVAILRRQMRIREIEVGGLASAVAASIIAIIAAWAGASYWAFALQLVLTEAFNLIYLMTISRWLPSGLPSARFGEARSAVQFGGFLAAERVLAELSRNMVVIFIGRAFTQVEAGLVYRAQMISMMPQRRIVTPLSGAFVPSLSRLQDDPEAFRDMYVRQVSRGNLLMVAIGLLICSCADVLVRIMLGPDWMAAAPLLAWLGLLPMTALTLGSFAWALVACGRGGRIFAFRCIAIVGLISALFASSSFGVVALVATFAIWQSFGQGAILAYMALKATPLTPATLRRALLGEIVFAATLGACLIGLRMVLELERIVAEAGLVVLVMAAVYGARMVVDDGMRRDVVKVLSRGRKGRTPQGSG